MPVKTMDLDWRKMKTAIIDKSPVMMEGLGHLLTNHYQIADLWTCASVGALRERYPDAYPDLVIIGMNKILHDSNLVVLGAVKAFFPAAKIVVISEHASLPVVLDFLRGGASGYVTYFISHDEFMQCISKVLKGKMFVPNELLPLMIREKHGLLQKKQTTRLTQREKYVAGLLSQDRRAGEIAKTLGVKAATIFATKRIIFRKLKIDTLFELKQAYDELLTDPVMA